MGNAGTKATRVSSRKRTVDNVSKLRNKDSVEFESRIDADSGMKGAGTPIVDTQRNSGDTAGHDLRAESGE